MPNFGNWWHARFPKKCEHGFVVGESREPEGIVYAAPIGFCLCCETVYHYIDSGIYGGDQERTVTNDVNRCLECGGSPMIVDILDGDLRVYEPGSHGPPSYDPDYDQEAGWRINDDREFEVVRG